MFKISLFKDEVSTNILIGFAIAAFTGVIILY